MSVVLNATLLVRFILKSFLIIATMSAVFGLQDVMTEDTKRSTQLAEAEATLVSPLLQFSSNLYIKAQNDKENLIFSPISIHKALNLVLLGADSQTQTEEQLLNTLGYSNLNKTVNEAHESYAKILAIFEEINKKGIAALKKAAEDEDSKETVFTGRFQDKPPVVDLWNMVIVKNEATLLDDYLAKVKRYYNSSVERIQDGQQEAKTRLVEQINSWAKDAGFESDVIKSQELDDDFQALLLSAVRVQAFWFSNFFEYERADIFFNYGLEDQLVRKGMALSNDNIDDCTYVEFTSQDRLKYPEFNRHVRGGNTSDLYHKLVDLNFHAVEIPLQGNIRFTIFEPLKQGPGELRKLIDQLMTPIDVNTGQTKLAMALQVMDSPGAVKKISSLNMPAFKFEGEIKLKPILHSMGLTRVFDKYHAQLSNITRGKLYVDDIKHQAVVEVNKHGLKAAGITQIRLNLLMALFSPEENINISIRNPFMFMVRYNNIPLFVGQLVHL